MNWKRIALASLVCAARTLAAEWQWSVPVPTPATTQPTKETPRAFLWIPPDCRRVRGVVFGQHNMEEESILQHPAFRKTLADIGFAEVWVAPGFDGNFRFDQGAGERLGRTLDALADASGYDELARAPLVPVGHSAAASMPWLIALWGPGRVIAGVSFSGQWPYVWDEKNTPQAAGRTLDTVPGIVTMGEYEWADDNLPKGLAVRAAHPRLPLSAVGCPADGHFAATDEKIELLALYVKKAARYRLADDWPTLKSIDPTKTGWLVDRYRLNKPPLAPAAPVAEYKGDPAQAFWFFDEEIAKAVEAFQARHRGQAPLLGYVQDGQTLPQKNGTHQQVTIAFKPLDDGVTFRLAGTFLDTVPDGRPARWTGKKANDPLEKPDRGPPISIDRITGPVKKLSDDTWTLDFYRASFLGDRRGNEAWLLAAWPGDGKFKRMVQQSVLRIPGRNKDGPSQTIDFPQPPDVPATTRELKLAATTDAGLPVRFYVREGPAEIDGDTLRLTAVPPRAKRPIAVTVVAWQFGRATDPKIQSAEPVERTLRITDR